MIRSVLALAVAAHVAAVQAQPRFAGKLELVPLFAAGHRPLQRNGHSYYAVRNPISFRTEAGDVLHVWPGQLTDLASIPAIIWPFMPPDGPWAEAAVFHDACYRTRGSFAHGAKHAGLAAPYTRAQCDDVLRQAMQALNVQPAPRVIIWAAVRMFGGGGWGT